MVLKDMILDETIKGMSIDKKREEVQRLTLEYSDIMKGMIIKWSSHWGSYKINSVFCRPNEEKTCSAVSNTTESLIRWRLEVMDDIDRSGCDGVARAKAYVERFEKE